MKKDEKQSVNIKYTLLHICGFIKQVNSINIYPSVVFVKLGDKEIDNGLYTETIIRKFKTES